MTVDPLDVALTASERAERHRLLLAVFHPDAAGAPLGLSVVDATDDSSDRIARHHRDLATLAEQECVDRDRDTDERP